jgi:hypothetical protein
MKIRTVQKAPRGSSVDGWAVMSMCCRAPGMSPSRTATALAIGAGVVPAGCQAAFVARPGAVLSPLGDAPGITGRDLGAVVEQIISIDG